MVLIYIDYRTPRVEYIMETLFTRFLGLPYALTQEKSQLEDHDGPGLIYGSKPLAEKFPFFRAADLLNEKELSNEEVPTSGQGKDTLLYPVDPPSTLPFDPFAASFYLLSRYEEYLPFSADEHGRFPPSESLAVKNGFVEYPVVDQWALKILQVLQDYFPDAGLTADRQFRSLSTVDVDNAFAYAGKSMYRKLGGISRALLKGDFGEAGERIRVITGRQKDPFDTFARQMTLHRKYQAESLYFFQFARPKGLDHNISFTRKKYRNWVRRVAQATRIGIHPSYASNGSLERLMEELTALKAVSGKDILVSRQHFLKLVFPDTYRKLIQAGIREDHTLGYVRQPGFRAGTCTPFPFYDLKMERTTNLLLHPFMVMDGGLIQNGGPEEGLQKIMTMMERVKEVNGTFISIWHNRIFSEKNEDWKGWNEVFEEMLEAAVNSQQ